MVLLEAWKSLEAQDGDEASLAKVQAKLPRVVKKMRKVPGEVGMMEECRCPLDTVMQVLMAAADYDMLFADDETASNPASLKFLELAHAWAAKKAAAAAAAAAAPVEEGEGEPEEPVVEAAEEEAEAVLMQE